MEALKDEISPPYRYSLKAQMVLSGFVRNADFARALECDNSQISRLVNGWLYPGPKMQKRLTAALGCTLKELRELL